MRSKRLVTETEIKSCGQCECCVWDVKGGYYTCSLNTDLHLRRMSDTAVECPLPDYGGEVQS